MEIEPITAPIEPVAERHAHPYFTAQPNGVVAAYVERFSRPGEVVLDPFSGSGTTAREALRLGRRAVAVDLSPLACHVTRFSCYGATAPDGLRETFQELRAACEARIRTLYERTEAEINGMPVPHWHPCGMRLPRNSDPG